MNPAEAPRPNTTIFFGLRLGLWYATLFVAGSTAIVFLTYYLTAASFAQRDQQIIRAKLGEYAAAYARGGARVLAATVRAEQQAAPERLYVRIVDRGIETVVLSNPDGWDPKSLETASVRLADGTLVEVGKSTEPREGAARAVSRRARVVTLSIVVDRADRRLARDAVRADADPPADLDGAQIIRTGRTDARVPLAGPNDAIDELTSLFNTMLDRSRGS
jgi:hypothetical protein